MKKEYIEALSNETLEKIDYEMEEMNKLEKFENKVDKFGKKLEKKLEKFGWECLKLGGLLALLALTLFLLPIILRW